MRDEAVFGYRATNKVRLQLSFFTGLGVEVQAQEGLIAQNTRAEIHQRTQRLLPQEPQGVIAVLFFAHPAITAAFPAEGARAVGWTNTPLLCAQDKDLPPNGLRVVLLRAPHGTAWVGLRGANTVQTSPQEAFLEISAALHQQNPSLPKAARGIITTVTSDIEAFSPQQSVEDLRWDRCISANGFELNVSSIPKVLRVLVLLETHEVARHVFLGETTRLRPDLGGR